MGGNVYRRLLLIYSLSISISDKNILITYSLTNREKEKKGQHSIRFRHEDFIPKEKEGRIHRIFTSNQNPADEQ